MQRLYFLITPNGDGFLDYARFFHDNRHNFAANGVDYALPMRSIFDVFSQQRLHVLLLNLVTARQGGEKSSPQVQQALQAAQAYLDDLEANTLPGRHVLLTFGLSSSSALPLLHDLLGDARRYPKLSALRWHMVWLLCRQDEEVEACARLMFGILPPEDIAERLLASDKVHKNIMLESALNLAAVDKCHVLFQDKGKRSTVPELLDALELTMPNGPLSPLPDTRLVSRDAVAFLHQLLQWNPRFFTYRQLAQVLCRAEQEGGFDTHTFVPPDSLKNVALQCRPGNEALVQVFPRCAPLLDVAEQDARADWYPYAGLRPETHQRLWHSIPLHADARIRAQFLQKFATDFPLLTDSSQNNATTFAQQCKIEWNPYASVAVLTLTRNHNHFIQDAIESVISQRTSFSVEHIIVDDASSDGTQKVIMDYAERYSHIKPVFLDFHCRNGENVEALFSRCRSPYVALCDGDDYFTDQYKLQKQFDYLNAHPECSMCFHQVHVLYEDGSNRERLYPPLESMPRGVRPFYYISDLFKANFIQTNSVMYRWRFKDGLPEWFKTNLIPGDWYWHLLHAEMGKIGFLEDVMSVYRRHVNSLYYTAENQISTVQHRLQHGLKELEMYSAINQHFGGRYERSLIGFANNVLVDFLKHARTTGEDDFLHEAGKRYPEFMTHFLKDVQIVRSNPPIN